MPPPGVGCFWRVPGTLPGALAGRVDTDAGLFEVRAAAPGTGGANSAASCRARRTAAPGTAPKSPSSPSFTGGELCHHGPRCPVEIPNGPVSNFESGRRGGDVGGGNRAGLLLTRSLSRAEPAWLWRQRSVSRLHPLPGQKRDGERGIKGNRGEKQDWGRWHVDAHGSSPSLFTDRFGGRRG